MSIKNRKSVEILISTLIAIVFSSSAFGNNGVEYLFCASDRHGNTTTIPQLLQRMVENGKEPTHAFLLGDMVGAHSGDCLEYTTSSLLEEVHSVASEAKVTVVQGNHDGCCIDDEGLFFDACSIIDMGTFFCFTLPYEAFPDTANVEYFRAWIDTLSDFRKPIFVMSHASLHHARVESDRTNDNAMLWHEAFNYAATGSDEGTKIVRNLIFLHGHDHSNDSRNYYFPAGGEIPIRVYGTVDVALAPDSLYPRYPNYYTVATAGYVTYRKCASLISVDEERICFERYYSDSISSSYAMSGGEGFDLPLVCIDRVGDGGAISDTEEIEDDGLLIEIRSVGNGTFEVEVANPSSDLTLCTLYNIYGQSLPFTKKASTITLQGGGVYLLRLGNLAKKVILVE